MGGPTQNSRLKDQLDRSSQYELYGRGLSDAPVFDRTELANLTERWVEIRKRNGDSSREAEHVRIELALRVPALLEFALKERPSVLTDVYVEMITDMVNSQPKTSLMYWVGRVVQIAVSVATPEVARKTLLEITARGNDCVYRRAVLAEKVFAKV
jgi:hypothetical protein